MAMCLTARKADAAVDRSLRVMRWVFRRRDDTIVCELGLNRDDSAYELRIDPPRNATGVTTETFHDAVDAFERHGRIERGLIEEGWSLERFESGVPR
jgi:hypothetical protein